MMTDEKGNAILAEIEKDTRMNVTIPAENGYQYLTATDFKEFAAWVRAKDARMVRLAAKVADAL